LVVQHARDHLSLRAPLPSGARHVAVDRRHGWNGDEPRRILTERPGGRRQWKAAGVPSEPGAPGRLDQGWVTTTENAIAESQAWYGKIFGAKASTRNNAPVSDVPGV
jgi:hypothetical protein